MYWIHWKRLWVKLEIDRYGFIGADIDMLAIYDPITDFPKFLNFYFLLHYQKYNVFHALPFFKNVKNWDLWAKIFQIAPI